MAFEAGRLATLYSPRMPAKPICNIRYLWRNSTGTAVNVPGFHPLDRQALKIGDARCGSNTSKGPQTLQVREWDQALGHEHRQGQSMSGDNTWTL